MEQKVKFLLAKKYEKIKILDIGCGVGNHLNIFKHIFPNAEIHGIEPSEISAKIAKQNNFQIFIDRFENIDMQPDEYDLIYSSHVIEHVERPDDFLEKCSFIAKKKMAIS